MRDLSLDAEPYVMQPEDDEQDVMAFKLRTFKGAQLAAYEHALLGPRPVHPKLKPGAIGDAYGDGSWTKQLVERRHIPMSRYEKLPSSFPRWREEELERLRENYLGQCMYDDRRSTNRILRGLRADLDQTRARIDALTDETRQLQSKAEEQLQRIHAFERLTARGLWCLNDHEADENPAADDTPSE
jgi:hypothetical protein